MKSLSASSYLNRNTPGISADLAVACDRLGTRGIHIRAIALREDIWPGLVEWHGIPVCRLSGGSPERFGVLV